MPYTIIIDGLSFEIQVESQDDDAKLHALVERIKQAGISVLVEPE